MHLKLNTFTSFVIELPKSVRINVCIPFFQDSNEQSSSAHESRRVRPMNEAGGEQLSGLHTVSTIGDTSNASESSSRGFTGVDVCGPVYKEHVENT